MVVFLICTVFCVGFFANSLVAYGLIPSYTPLLAEGSVYLLLIYALFYRAKNHEQFQLHLSWILALFILVGACSIIVNKYYNLRPIFSIRLVLRFFVFYIALINVGLRDTDFKIINKFLMGIFIIQLPVIAYKFSIYGVAEETIGTYAKRGGGLTTVIPIVIVSYLVSFYVIYRQKLWYLVIALCYVIWGIIGAKAALFFLYPPTFFGLYYLTVIKPKGFKFVRDATMGVVVSIITVSVLSVLIYAQPRMNKGREVGGKIDFEYALEFAHDYSTSMNRSDDRVAGGRTATLKLTMEHLTDDGFTNFIFGYGPGILTKSIFDKRRPSDPRIWRIAESYGITGMILVWVEYGVLGVILICALYLSFLRLSWNWYSSENSSYWKAFAAGSIFFSILYLFIFLTYNKLPIEGETMLPVFYYAMAAAHEKYLMKNRNFEVVGSY
jgi:hypothetical protein